MADWPFRRSPAELGRITASTDAHIAGDAPWADQIPIGAPSNDQLAVFGDRRPTSNVHPAPTDAQIAKLANWRTPTLPIG
jgi:hypothetical protein